MDKETARRFKDLVNTPEFARLFPELMDEIIKQEQKGIEEILNETDLRIKQGKIKAQIKLKSIRDTINDKAK